ncbi:Putative hemolysin [Desulfacinum hydrothermale DSM 13146]|uniref:Putative hemolysin n=2 Tax=Desulfacinum hydrothermale TaxID=109258 RepID=A0A1W1XI47_9BACT|nr:Putative hemolysin [Desulfacinum hydrothermale DSM 13146]
MKDQEPSLFVPNGGAGPLHPSRWFKSLGKIAALDQLDEVYRSMAGRRDLKGFLEEALRALQVQVRLHGTTETIPRHGPVILAANHPFGGLEGIILARILLDIRPDVKILANWLLAQIQEVRQLVIGVDPFGRKGAIERNVRPLRRCLKWLESGGALVLFPAGTVSHVHIRRRRIMDPPWNPTVARLAFLSRCPVVPVYIEGRNSLLFQLLGLVHPRLRTLMLPRELLNKSGTTVSVTVGTPVTFRDPLPGQEACHAAEYLRARTYALGLGRVSGGSPGTRTGFSPHATSSRPLLQRSPVAPSVPAELLEQDVRCLPDTDSLLQSGPYRVYCTTAQRIPHVMREIGRLREIAFRNAGEGTGRSIDLDRFDAYYEHLFVWHQVERHVVGAYRIARADQILRRFGLSGLYTHTLFTYKPAICHLLQTSLELGRSFVRPEYQKAYAPLWLLWKGIGRYVARRRIYTHLIGPVSISDDYHVLSRHLIQSVLQAHYFSWDLGRWVRARKPPRFTPSAPWDTRLLCRGLGDVDLFSELVADLEDRKRSLPVLLRHYLKVGGTVLGFNVDPRFSNALDVLVMVDLTQGDYKLLEKTMGKENARSYLAWHAGRCRTAKAA